MSCDNFRQNKHSQCNNNRVVVAEENRMKYILENNNRKEICKIKVDDGYIQNETIKKCDYLFLNCQDNIALFIELKGSDLFKAINQINTSIDYFIDNLTDFSINARIVLTKVNVPNLENNPKYLKFIKKLKRYNGNLIKRTRQINEKT